MAGLAEIKTNSAPNLELGLSFAKAVTKMNCCDQIDQADKIWNGWKISAAVLIHRWDENFIHISLTDNQHWYENRLWYEKSSLRWKMQGKFIIVMKVYLSKLLILRGIIHWDDQISDNLSEKQGLKFNNWASPNNFVTVP